jgi:hypothetical protein
MNPTRIALLGISLAAGAAGCLMLPDQAVENRGRQPLEVESINVSEGQRSVPLDTSIEIRFNQPLDPASLDDADTSLTSGSLTAPSDLRYDALRRALVLDPRSNLRETLWYTLSMEKFPLSIMGTAYLGDPLEIRFKTGIETSSPAPRPGVTFEDDVWPLLSGCSCHDQESRYMDYVVIYDEPSDFLEHSVSTPSREWRDWLIVDPGHHESSYLIYKLLGDERLGMPTIMGEVMPPGTPLPYEDLETIRDWIEQGAGP